MIPASDIQLQIDDLKNQKFDLERDLESGLSDAENEEDKPGIIKYYTNQIEELENQIEKLEELKEERTF